MKLTYNCKITQIGRGILIFSKKQPKNKMQTEYTYVV